MPCRHPRALQRQAAEYSGSNPPPMSYSGRLQLGRTRASQRGHFLIGAVRRSDLLYMCLMLVMP